MHNDIQVIIMAGGIGSRFWPMSTPDYPKQFIDVMGVGRSLIQLTVDRLKPICPVENMWVVTNEKYISIVKEQIPDMPVDNILAEPEARNTAPCIAYACWRIQKQHPNANIVVTPSDALVINTSEYQRVLSKALSYTADKEKEVVGRLFPTCEKISIDYAVIEKSKDIFTLPAEFGWSDLGSWGSLRTLLPQDDNGNAKVGKDIRLYDCKNCVVHAADETKVVVQGLDGYIIAEKHGQLLVCQLKEEQRIKEFSK